LTVQPRVWARYEFGREKMTDLKGKCALRCQLQREIAIGWGSARCIEANIGTGLDDKAIEDKVTALVKESA